MKLFSFKRKKKNAGNPGKNDSFKIKILEYERQKLGKIRVRSHNCHKGKWKPNPNFDLHKRLIESQMLAPVIYSKEYEVEVYG